MRSQQEFDDAIRVLIDAASEAGITCVVGVISKAGVYTGGVAGSPVNMYGLTGLLTAEVKNAINKGPIK